MGLVGYGRHGVMAGFAQGRAGMGGAGGSGGGHRHKKITDKDVESLDIILAIKILTRERQTLNIPVVIMFPH